MESADGEDGEKRGGGARWRRWAAAGGDGAAILWLWASGVDSPCASVWSSCSSLFDGYISQTVKLEALGIPAYRSFSLVELEAATNDFEVDGERRGTRRRH
ncbi:Os02g0599966 [Oryza sativa Japonica Group]|uniref:Os02g0599966 protein n=1 Tax=Oryza sativa subsp. japonica TaxID=39947 RepID=C7IYW1_ORYSJ|nr:Os02g0599966 [Oryza sativa Japonica Group]|eukprot:NP_001173060.1 Os02g0599966 [Oryza sativa Japonica Group]